MTAMLLRGLPSQLGYSCHPRPWLKQSAFAGFKQMLTAGDLPNDTTPAGAIQPRTAAVLSFW